MEIWDKLNKDDTLTHLDKQLSPKWDGNDPHRSVFYLCCEMIQLMEDVYLDLNFEETWTHVDNQGWQNLFLQWAKSPLFRNTWEKTQATYGQRFQSFWRRHLDPNK